MSQHAIEVARGERFEFGANWAKFLAALNEERIAEATRSLQSLLGVVSLEGRRFLDAGSGSGLFSLAARRLGAQVYSFDFDPQSVACTTELRRRYSSTDGWEIESGSVLDRHYLARLGKFDVVYSWGVLHHTGDMWTAIANVAELVRPGGILFIAIYNYQSFFTPYWKGVKRLYNKMPRPARVLFAAAYFCFFAVELFVADVLRGRNPARRYRGSDRRGMTIYYDVVDWVGGWPFEAATPEAVFRFLRDRGFVLADLVTVGGKHGCNEFVLRLSSPA